MKLSISDIHNITTFDLSKRNDFNFVELCNLLIDFSEGNFEVYKKLGYSYYAINDYENTILHLKKNISFR